MTEKNSKKEVQVNNFKGKLNTDFCLWNLLKIQ